MHTKNNYILIGVTLFDLFNLSFSKAVRTLSNDSIFGTNLTCMSNTTLYHTLGPFETFLHHIQSSFPVLELATVTMKEPSQGK